MTFATPTSVAGYLSQKRHHVTKSTIISMSLPKSGIFPWPNHWRDEVMWCNSPKPIFHSLLFFFTCPESFTLRMHLDFCLANIDLTRSDWIWLTIDSQEIILIQRLLFSWQSWYDVCSLWIACTLWIYRKHFWVLSGSKWYKTWRQSNSQTKNSAHEHFRNTC